MRISEETKNLRNIPTGQPKKLASVIHQFNGCLLHQKKDHIKNQNSTMKKIKNTKKQTNISLNFNIKYAVISCRSKKQGLI